jgi:hypothetical protein
MNSYYYCCLRLVNTQAASSRDKIQHGNFNLEQLYDFQYWDKFFHQYYRQGRSRMAMGQMILSQTLLKIAVKTMV